MKIEISFISFVRHKKSVDKLWILPEQGQKQKNTSAFVCRKEISDSREL